MERIFLEIGFGNDSFISTEIENGTEEYRINKIINFSKVDDFYIRIWLFRRVIIFSIKEGIKFVSKNKYKIKFVLGVSGKREI